MRKTLLILLLALWVNHAFTSEMTSEMTKEKRGWHWYDIIKEKPKDRERDQDKEKEPMLALPLQRTALPPSPPVESLMTWHPDDIQKGLDAYHKQFIWQPTPENAENYLRFEEVSLKKSIAVAAVKSYVVQTNPEYDLNKDYPRNQAGQDIFYTKRQQSMRQYLSLQKGRYGLVYFVSETCQYCELQDAIVQSFVERYGYDLAVVDIKRNPVAAQRFDISFTPQIILVERETKAWMTVANGVVPITSLEENTYRVIRLLRKEVSPEQFYTMGDDGNRALDPLRTGGTP